jgi:ribonuclease P protein component
VQGIQRRSMQARRLKTREQFQVVLACAPFARTEHFVMHRMVLDASSTQTVLQPSFAAEGPWIGAMVPKRWARRAVTRNLIKRQIYSHAEQHASALPAHAYLVRLRSAFDRVQFASSASDALRVAVRREIEQLFSKVLPPATGAA